MAGTFNGGAAGVCPGLAPKGERMKAILILQGSLSSLNSRDGRPLFMEPVAERPLLGLLLEEASASGCFGQMAFVTSAAACDDPVVEYLEAAWPAIEVLRIEADSPYALGTASRRDRVLGTVEYGGILSVEGYRAIAPSFARDPSQVSFVLDVNDAPLCSRRYFEKALPLAREIGFVSGIAPGAASLCGFPMRAFDKMSGHQRSLRVSESAAARERVERAMQAIRREKHLASAEQVEAVHAWQIARAERYGPYRGGSLVETARDWVARHADAAERQRFTRQAVGEAISITTRTALDMVRAAYDLPGPGDAPGAEHWLQRFEQRAPHREGRKAFYPDYPSYLEVELTSRCNLACRFCPQTKLTRPKGDLDYGELERLLDRVGDFVTLLNFSGFGEPTLHARLFDCVRLAKSRGIPRVEIETNGTAIDEAFLDEVFASGLDILAVNLDAVETIRSDEAGKRPFGSVFELVRRIIERRGEAVRPFLVLQRINMAVPEQDAKVTRDFALWYDVADAFVLRPYNGYRGALPDRRVINFAPLDRAACKKLLASALVLSSGETVMCEQCFDGSGAVANEPGERESGISAASGEAPFLRRLLVEQDHGRVGGFCAPCAQWYQQDVAWTVPGASRLWFERALARSVTELTEGLFAEDGEALARTHVPELIRRSGDYDDELRRKCEHKIGRRRWTEAEPEGLPAARGRIGAKSAGDGELVDPVACAVLGERLYVTDGGRRRVAVYSVDGRFEKAFGETGEAFGRLPDIAVVDGELLVAEAGRIQRFSSDGELLGLLAPDLGGASLSGIAAGGPGRLFVAGDDSRVHLVDVESGGIVHSMCDPSWIKIFVSSSPAVGELFVSSVDQHEVFVFDLDGAPIRRVGRDQVGRLASPVHVLGCGEAGYAVSNWEWHEILVLSSSFEYVGALDAPGLRGSSAYGAGRLFTVVNRPEPGCLVCQFQPVASRAFSGSAPKGA
jgi:organic radical activating enzyme